MGRKTRKVNSDLDWFGDDITFCSADCSRECRRQPKNIINKDIPHSFSDFSETCGSYRPRRGKR